MTIHQVQEAMHRQPFRPFHVRLADGRSFEVSHPDFIAYAPNGREPTIHDDEGVHLLEMGLAAEIHLPQTATAGD
jgi:glutathione S-transferase